jgi:hypothetical protein
MAKNIPEINVLTDTFNTWVLRTNDVIQSIGSEVITANSTLGVTGRSDSLRNARLFGTFTTTNLVANSFTITPGISGNSSAFSISTNIALVANSSPGTSGQVLTSSGSGVYWAAAAAGGSGITSLTAGNGIEFTPGGEITTNGTIRAKAGDNSIVVNASGISVNTTFISGLSTNASTLLNRTWAAPAAIGSAAANTGNFTTVTSSAATGYRLSGDNNFIANSSILRTSGRIDVTTPNDSTTGGVRIRTNATSGLAYLQITNAAGVEKSHFSFNHNDTGYAIYTADFQVNGTLWANGLSFASATIREGPFPGTSVGYKNIPQIIVNATTPIDINYTQAAGAHYYKIPGVGVNTITFIAAGTTIPFGTAITFVNDSSSNMTLGQGAGVILLIAGTTTGGSITIAPGGVATALYVAANKWFVSGAGIS